MPDWVIILSMKSFIITQGGASKTVLSFKLNEHATLIWDYPALEQTLWPQGLQPVYETLFSSNISQPQHTQGHIKMKKILKHWLYFNIYEQCIHSIHKILHDFIIDISRKILNLDRKEERKKILRLHISLIPGNKLEKHSESAFLSSWTSMAIFLWHQRDVFTHRAAALDSLYTPEMAVRENPNRSGVCEIPIWH